MTNTKPKVTMATVFTVAVPVDWPEALKPGSYFSVTITDDTITALDMTSMILVNPYQEDHHDILLQYLCYRTAVDLLAMAKLHEPRIARESMQAHLDALPDFTWVKAIKNMARNNHEINIY